MAGDVEINLLHVDLSRDILRIQNEVAAQMAADLKQRSPKSNNRGTHYANGWTFTPDGDSVVVHNKGRKASLSSLLELGHMNVNGTRTPPRPHVQPSYDKYGSIYQSRMAGINITIK